MLRIQTGWYAAWTSEKNFLMDIIGQLSCGRGRRGGYGGGGYGGGMMPSMPRPIYIQPYPAAMPYGGGGGYGGYGEMPAAAPAAAGAVEEYAKKTKRDTNMISRLQKFLNL
ncbi:unnamed protein product [Soboliphyme baturini]|uniref:Uncharacterized protein n=1 Tax=Soboliphyme baturini TaxID=241478 RepID=A0A183IDL8_9BILA|nr:unnamed protein product [Soboliphyme baturini]